MAVRSSRTRAGVVITTVMDRTALVSGRARGVA